MKEDGKTILVSEIKKLQNFIYDYLYTCECLGSLASKDEVNKVFESCLAKEEIKNE